VRQAASEARNRDVEWLHIAYGQQLRKVFDLCGFRPVKAGLLHLTASPAGWGSRGVAGEE
jgi:hypothetical protein